MKTSSSAGARNLYKNVHTHCKHSTCMPSKSSHTGYSRLSQDRTESSPLLCRECGVCVRSSAFICVTYIHVRHIRTSCENILCLRVGGGGSRMSYNYVRKCELARRKYYISCVARSERKRRDIPGFAFIGICEWYVLFERVNIMTF